MTSTGSFISFGTYSTLAKRNCKEENIDTNTYLVSIFEVGRVAKKTNLNNKCTFDKETPRPTTRYKKQI